MGMRYYTACLNTSSWFIIQCLYPVHTLKPETTFGQCMKFKKAIIFDQIFFFCQHFVIMLALDATEEMLLTLSAPCVGGKAAINEVHLVQMYQRGNYLEFSKHMARLCNIEFIHDSLSTS